MYLEGGDQYRGWFQSSLLIGVGLRGRAPYRQTATHGWTLDGDGRPLSKSLGNGTAPEEIIKEYGAELIRLWTASVDFHRRRSHLAHDPDASFRGVSKNSQYVPLLAREYP